MSAEVIGPLRDYLVAQGVVRKPSVAGALPPCWLEPREGLPAPGEKPPNGSATQVGPTVVLGLFRTGGIAVGPYESSWRERTLDLRIRAQTGAQVRDIEQLITPLIIDKHGWQMGAMAVIDSEMWRELQPIQINVQGYHFVVSYRFVVYSS